MDGSSIVSMFVVLFAVILILFLAWWCSRYLGKTWNRHAKGKYMTVIDSMPVGQDRTLLIVKIEETCYLVGSSAAGVQLLCELSLDFSQQPEEGSVPPVNPYINPEFQKKFQEFAKKFSKKHPDGKQQ